MSYFKIKNQYGQFSSGGHPPVFKNKGKLFGLTELKGHLTMIAKYQHSLSVYAGCTLVIFTESAEPAIVTLEDLMEPLNQIIMIDKLKGKI